MTTIVIIQLHGTSILKIGSTLVEGGGGWLSPSRWQCIAAVVAGCRKAFASPEWSHLSPFPAHFRGSVSGIVGIFQSAGAFPGWRALTIECSLVSGYGQGRELVKTSVAQAAKLLPSWSRNTDKKTRIKYNSVVKQLIYFIFSRYHPWLVIVIEY